MARFSRKIEREKTYEFTKKAVLKKSNKQIIKENFGIQWFPRTIKNTLIAFIILVIVSFTIVPMISMVVSTDIAFIIGHTFFTSFFIVLLFSYKKLELVSFITRYVFLILLIGCGTYISVVIL